MVHTSCEINARPRGSTLQARARKEAQLRDAQANRAAQQERTIKAVRSERQERGQQNLEMQTEVRELDFEGMVRA